MKVLVTGASGFIGSHLCERLLQDGHEVIGVDSYSDYYSRALKLKNAQSVTSHGGVIHEIDLAVDDLSSLKSGVQAVFHLAGQPGLSATVPFELYERNNILATRRLLDALQESPSLTAFVHFSTSSVYGKQATGDEETAPQPASAYGVTKLAGEQLVLSRYRDAGFPALSIRPFSIIGERERPEKLFPKLMHAIHNDTPLTLYEGSLDHVRSFTYVGDLVEGALLALAKRDVSLGEIFNIGNDSTNTVGEAIEYVENHMNKRAVFQHVPKRAGDQSETRAQIQKARTLLGYEPTVSLEEALRREVSWFLEMHQV